MLFFNSRAFFTVLIVLITSHNLTSSIKWSDEKGKIIQEEQAKRLTQFSETGKWSHDLSSIRFVRNEEGRIYLFVPEVLAHEEINWISYRIEEELEKKNLPARSVVQGVIRLEGRLKKAFQRSPMEMPTNDVDPVSILKKEYTDKDFENDYKYSAEETSTLTTSTHNLTSSIKWSDEKDRECLSQCNCDPQRQQIEPVCGRDGRTYGNKCSITCAHCYLANASVSIAHDGPCGGRNQSVATFRWWPDHKEYAERAFEDDNNYSEEVTSPHTTG